MPTTQQLTETLLDQNDDPMDPSGQPAAVWASDDTDVATVNGTGLVTRGTVAGTANITVTRGAIVSNACVVTVPSLAGGLTMPSTAAADRELWWDAVNGVMDGPAVAVIGAPELIGTEPEHYLLDPADSEAFSWGANLDSIFTSPDGFAVVAAYAADATGSERFIAHKTDITGQTTFQMVKGAGGALFVRIFYATDGSTEEANISSAVINDTGRHVVGFSFDPTQAFGSRVRLWCDGANQDAGDVPTTNGAGAALPAVGTAAFRIGATSFGSQSVARLRALGVYSRALNDAEHIALASHVSGEGWV